MSDNKTIASVLIIVLLVIAIPTALFVRKLPTRELTPAEKELSSFSSKPVSMSSPLAQATFTGHTNPVTAAAVPKSDIMPKNVSSPAAAPGTTKVIKKVQPRSLGSLPVVSMISYDSATRTAIVNNTVVTEGSGLDGGKIVRIEEYRVLMRRAGKNIWLSIE